MLLQDLSLSTASLPLLLPKPGSPKKYICVIEETFKEVQSPFVSSAIVVKDGLVTKSRSVEGHG